MYLLTRTSLAIFPFLSTINVHGAPSKYSQITADRLIVIWTTDRLMKLRYIYSTETV